MAKIKSFNLFIFYNVTYSLGIKIRELMERGFILLININLEKNERIKIIYHSYFNNRESYIVKVTLFN